LDGEKIFPIRETALRELLASILEPATDDDEQDPTDPLDAKRRTTLRVLKAYRALCGVPWRELELVPEWNSLCDAAAEICRRNGALSHDPPRPPDTDDELYERGKTGAKNSNIHRGGGMVDSVDGYMDDSDPSNIQRVGHRRWCLNPTMRRTAFGESGGFAAMWSMDRSGAVPRGLDAILYPPRGWVPVDFFGPRHAWSVILVRGGTPRAERVQVRIEELDEHWVRTGTVLELDHLGVDTSGVGTGPVIVFRPQGLRVEPGARYLAEVSTDGGKSVEYRWVVAFTAPVRR
jgi:hypothetical protein